MRLNKRSGKMYKKVTHTGTFMEGCDHDCYYCFGKFLPWGSVNHDNPRLVQTDMKQVLTVRNAYIFLNSAHDAFSECIPSEWITTMLDWIAIQHPSNEFLIQTKNTPRFAHFIDEMQTVRDNIYLGTTIETNRWRSYHKYSDAVPPTQRAFDMATLKTHYGFNTMGSLEPLMDFDVNLLSRMVIGFKPEYVEIGLDNYEKRHLRPLPTPSLTKRQEIVDRLKDAGIEVIIKDGFWRDE